MNEIIDYKRMDGPTWTWFTDPQDQYDPVSEKIYIGVQLVDRPALISYDCNTNESQTILLGNVPEVLEKDDHNNPSVRILSNGHILTCYTLHNTIDGWWYQVSVNPNDITEFHPPEFIPSSDGMTYSHVWEIDGIVYNLSRAASQNRTWQVWSSPIGVGPNLNWTNSIDVWKGVGNGVNANTFGYLVSRQTGDRVDFLVSDDHPIFQSDRVGHFYFDGEYRKTDGTVLTAPFDFDDLDVIFDADESNTGDRVWVTDVAFDGSNPRVLWMRYPEGSGSIQELNYSEYDGSNWNRRIVIEQQGNGWLRPERFYNGEAHFDPSNLDRIIQAVRVNGVYEIQHFSWTGNRYAVGAFTRDSERDQLRPRLVDTEDNKSPFAYWIDPVSYVDFDNYESAIRINRLAVD